MEGSPYINKEEQGLKLIKAGVEKLQASKQPKKEPRELKQIHHTAWWLVDLVDTDKQVYNILKKSLELTANPKRPFRKINDLARYFVFLYLSGARRNELFIKDPTITRYTKEGLTFWKIGRINEKHFEGRNHDRREWQVSVYRAWNIYERALFDYVMEGRAALTIDFVGPLILHSIPQDKLKFDKLSDAEKTVEIDMRSANITKAMAKVFRTRITDGHTVIEDGGITPHMLRHTRCYDLLMNKGLRDGQVARMIGWRDVKMVQHYAYVARAMREEEMERMYFNMPERKTSPEIFKPSTPSVSDASHV
ncbi:MAG: site-specific integrase [Candidatus Micrarchaeota archaeon]|nr:site-specific integrase [Candidatus Micrarchaeota archaeon]MDE1859187.1 site-specific integrase [Candidatus Micrarchaeota archaeon]